MEILGLKNLWIKNKVLFSVNQIYINKRESFFVNAKILVAKNIKSEAEKIHNHIGYLYIGTDYLLKV